MRHIGAWCWILAAPLFLAFNVVAGVPWRPSYSWAADNISDLGNVSCGMWDTTRPRYVCSPWHGLMNAGLVLTAVLLAVGAVLAWRGRFSRVLLLLAASGYALAGLFPADSNENGHFLGALLILVVGNVGLLAAARAVEGWQREWTLVMAGLAILGTGLFFTQRGLGIGVGGMERIAVFPLLIWAAATGIQTLASSPALSGDRRSLRSPTSTRRSRPLSSQETPKAHTETTSPT
jgi:hypothetical membrane protein